MSNVYYSQYVYIEEDVLSFREEKVTNAKLLYSYLLSKSNDGGRSSSVKYETIEEEMGIHRETVSNLVKKLSELHFLEVEPGDYNNSNTYYFRENTYRPIRVDMDIITNSATKKIPSKLIYILLRNSPLPMTKKEILDRIGTGGTAFQEAKKELGDKLITMHYGSKNNPNYYMYGVGYKHFAETVKYAYENKKSLMEAECLRKTGKGFVETRDFIEERIGKSYFLDDVSPTAFAAVKLRDAIIYDLVLRSELKNTYYNILCLDDEFRFTALIKEFLRFEDYPNCSAVLHSFVKKQSKTKDKKDSDGAEVVIKKKKSRKAISDTLKKYEDFYPASMLNLSSEVERIVVDAVVKSVSENEIICESCFDGREFRFVSKDCHPGIGSRYRMYLYPMGEGMFRAERLTPLELKAADNVGDDEFAFCVTEQEKQGKNYRILRGIVFRSVNGLSVPYLANVRIDNVWKSIPKFSEGLVLILKGSMYSTVSQGMVINSDSFRYAVETEGQKYAFLTQITGLSSWQARLICHEPGALDMPFDKTVFTALLEKQGIEKPDIYTDICLAVFCPSEIEDIIKKGVSELNHEGEESDERRIAEIRDIACEKYGYEALNKIENDPYVLLECGCNFAFCDRIAIIEGIDGKDRRRLKAFVKYAVDREVENGSIGITAENALALLKEQPYDVEISIDELKKAVRHLESIRVIGEDVFVDKKLDDMEKSIADKIFMLNTVNGIDMVFDKEKILKTAQDLFGSSEEVLSEDKYPAIGLLKKTGVSIITGGAGTGKSRVIQVIVELFGELCPKKKVAICAPTGKAAENLNAKGDFNAVTMHSLLGIKKDEDLRNSPPGIAEKTMEADLIIVDEASMIDTMLGERFFRNIRSGTRVILVGDSNQLPPVEPGQIFFDLIQFYEDKLADRLVRLTDIHRQEGESGIISNSFRIIRGDTDLQVGEDFVIKKYDNDKQLEAAVSTLMKNKLENIDDIQVVVPVKKGISAVRRLNFIIQDMCSSSVSSVKFGGEKYCVGDRIIFLRNTRFYKNGQLGVIKMVSEDPPAVSIDTGKEEPVILGRARFRDFMLAYAMTVHKSQGSQFPEVVVALRDDNTDFVSRKLLYTAVTRAKKKLYLLYVGDSLEKAINSVMSNSERLTFLREKLEEAGSKDN